MLLDAGSDMAARGLDGMTALHLAARCGHTAVVQRLLEHGANPGAVSKERHTPLHECAAGAQLGVAEQLLLFLSLTLALALALTLTRILT